MVTFNALATSLCGKIMEALPERATLYQYSNIGMKDLGIFKPEDFLFKNKTLKGFWVSRYLETMSDVHIDEFKKAVADDLAPSGKNIFASTIQAEFPLDQYEVARTQYIKNMSKGKVLLVP